jgi:hypothetical protein
VTTTGDGEQYFNIRSKLEHPNYNAGNALAYDFSILQLATSVTVPSPTAGIVCLPTVLSQTFVGETLKISGWGTTVYGGSRSNLLKGASVTGKHHKRVNNTFEIKIHLARGDFYQFINITFPYLIVTNFKFSY